MRRTPSASADGGPPTPTDRAPAPGRLIFVFVDGLGLGRLSRDNPLVAARTPTLLSLLGAPLTAEAEPVSRDALTFRLLDATLGVGGLPQSATGQTTLLTGRNGAAEMGRHYGPWPGPTLKRLLDHDTLFHDAERAGGAALANAYPEGYFRALERGRLRPNAPVVAARSAGTELRGLDQYGAGLAVAADLSGERFVEFGTGLRPQPPEAAAAALAALAASNPFTFLDVWTTDQAGHAQDERSAVVLLERLDELLGALLDLADAARAGGTPFTVLLTSDHGNVEDLTTKGHTRNPVPLLAFGPGAREFRAAEALTDVAPAVRRLWGTEHA